MSNTSLDAGVAATAVFPGLPAQVWPLARDEPLWGYPAASLAGTGAARLRAWPVYDRVDGRRGYLVIVTELGLGTSITNAIEQIHTALESYHGTVAHAEAVEAFGEAFAGRGMPLRDPSYFVLLEHYPADQDPLEGGHLDQVVITEAGPRWRRIWPTADANTCHVEFTGWMEQHGHRMLAAQLGYVEPRPVIGPHCSHTEYSWHTCDHSGYVEHPCTTDGCPLCGGTTVLSPEHWAGDPDLLAAMSDAEQARVRGYWRRYPLVRRPGDPEVITDDRLAAARDGEQE